MAKSILEEAFQDAKILKQTAIENAKNVLVEAMTPKIREFVETQLGEISLGGDDQEEQEGIPMMLVPAMPKQHSAPKLGHGLSLAPEAQMYEAAPEEDEVPDFLADMDLDDDGESDSKPNPFAGKKGEDSEEEESDDEDSEEEDSEEEDSEEEDEEDSEEEEEKDDMEKEGLELEATDVQEVKEEVVEITNEDLKEALKEVLNSLKTEATVTKGFGDAEDATIKNAGGAGSKGIADEKSGEHQWSNVMPPAATDMTVKEAKRYIVQVHKANQALKKENAEYKKAYGYLRGKLQETNLFNSKLLFTHKLLNLSELNDKQRIAVVEAFDRAGNMREVELVYRSLSESFKIAGVLSESKKVKASQAKASRLSAPSSTVLKEALSREEKAQENGADSQLARWQLLSGLTE